MPPEHRAKVADFCLKLFEGRASEAAHRSKRVLSKAGELILGYAVAAQTPRIEALAANERVEESWRVQFRELAEKLRDEE